MSILLDKTNRVIVQGVTGQMGQFFVEDARKYGTNMVAGVSPGRAGTTVGDVPVFASVRAAVDATRADTAMVFVPPAAVLGAALEALECGCKLVVATADEMPVLDAIEVRAAARANGAVFVGPNTPGLISPGKAKMGFMPSFCYTQGNVGVISRSGSLSYEGSKRITTAGFAELGRSARDLQCGGERRHVERRKHQRDRERPLLCTEERLVQIGIQRRELRGSRLLWQLGVRPEALERSVLGRIRCHRLDRWRSG